MTVIPVERAGMASGVAGTVRFSGIVVGFAALGAILVNRVSDTISAGLPADLAGERLALIRQVDLNDPGAFALEGSDGRIEYACYFRVEIVDVEGTRHTDGDALHRSRGRLDVIRHRYSDCSRIGRIRTRHQTEQDGAIFRRARERTDRVERLRQRHRAGAAHAPYRRLQSGHAAEMRRHPDRTAGIGAKRRKRQSRRDGRARS